jgi:hypothetical protein
MASIFCSRVDSILYKQRNEQHRTVWDAAERARKGYGMERMQLYPTVAPSSMSLAKTQVLDGSFTDAVKQVVARRTGYRCSNPRCRKPTMGPHSIDPDGFEYVGESAHICANQPKGERYDSDQTMEQRGSIANAVHLCCTCHTLVDKPKAAERGYTSSLMREWKQQAEARAEIALLRGEGTESLLGELQAEVKLLTLQIENMQREISKLALSKNDDDDTEATEPF